MFLRCNHTGLEVPYAIESGFDLMRVQELHEQWSASSATVLSEILKAYPEIRRESALIPEIFSKYNFGDYGWNWQKKSLYCHSSEYHWFFLSAENKIQAACILYHPKASLYDNKNIFYIDYIASAHWNRTRPNYTPKFNRTGTKLIQHSIQYARNVWNYRPGFCLHSLPNAEGYYSNLGMQDFGIDENKEGLRFFEAPEQVACRIGGLSYEI